MNVRQAQSSLWLLVGAGGLGFRIQGLGFRVQGSGNGKENGNYGIFWGIQKGYCMDPFPSFKSPCEEIAVVLSRHNPYVWVLRTIPKTWYVGCRNHKGVLKLKEGKRNVEVYGFLKGQSWSRRYTSPHQTTAPAHSQEHGGTLVYFEVSHVVALTVVGRNLPQCMATLRLLNKKSPVPASKLQS